MRLKEWRIYREMTQVTLAKSTGMGVMTISNIETGRVKRPHPATVRLLEWALDAGRDELFSSPPGKERRSHQRRQWVRPFFMLERSDDE